MSARERAAGILGPGKLRQLEEAGLVVVEGEPWAWQCQHNNTWGQPLTRSFAERVATTYGRSTGRIRPLYAGDPQEVEG